MRFGLAITGLVLGFAASSPGLAAGTSAAQVQRVAAESIHRLGPDAHQLRFEGETSAKSWSIYVTAAQSQTRARVHLAYSNAISVMPEVSTLAISINDVPVAQTPIAAASDPGALDVELPQGLLTSGYNTVRIAATQRHRVDCSLEATYELWTQLDPTVSGLTFPGLADAAIGTLDDLAAISPDATGAVPIRAVIADNASGADVDRVMNAVEAVAIRAGVVRPSVDVVDTIDERPGLWILAGLRGDLKSRGLGRFLSDSDVPTITGGDVPGRVIVVAAGEDARSTMASITQILPRRAEDRTATISAARTLANLRGFPVSGNMNVSFHDLGVQTEEFNGRLFRSGFDILMPPDFYPADYDKLTLAISAGYSPGLSPGSQILVRVNDKEAGSLPLRNPKGDLFRDRPISVSLGALRPGVNHIVIEAQTPNSEDTACDVKSLLEAKKRFVLFDRSELEMPSLARIARMPNLAVTMTSAFPYLGADDGLIFLAKHDRATIGAATTFLARTAFVARRLIAARVTFDRAKLGAGSIMFFGALEDYNSSMFERFGVDYNALKEAWARPNSAEPAASEAPSRKAAPVEAEASQGNIFDQWADGVHAEPTSFGAKFSFRALYDRYINVHRSDFALLREPDAKIEVPDRATLLIAQTHGPVSGPDTWTLIVAANSASLTRDMRGLVAPSNWNLVDGRAAVFSSKAGASNVAQPVDSYFIPTQTLTPSNLRLVAAGWLSSNIDYYVIAMAIAAVILGVVTTLAVRAHGVHK